MGVPVAAPRLSVVDADMRDDVSIVVLREVQALWLRPERLWAVERETETLLVFDDGGGSALDPGTRRLLVCGWSEPQRHRARERAEAVGKGGSEAIAALVGAPLAAAATVEAPAAETLKRPAQLVSSDPKRAKPARSDPRNVLKTMVWPATINQWGMLQNTIWAGHPKLTKGWIRCWSRSQDSEYYLRLEDKSTTFNLSDVLSPE